MKLYKIRSLQNMDLALDILINQRLYCAPFEQLNDPFEGLFSSMQKHPDSASDAPFSFNNREEFYHSVDYLLLDNQEARICSLSSSIKDVRMWSHYGDSHKGIAIEMEFDNADRRIKKINYSRQLPSLTKNTPLHNKTEEILTVKTLHWEHESEYRVIQEDMYFPITNRITAIHLGINISDLHEGLLRKIVPSTIAIVNTKLNHSDVTIESELD